MNKTQNNSALKPNSDPIERQIHQTELCVSTFSYLHRNDPTERAPIPQTKLAVSTRLSTPATRCVKIHSSWTALPAAKSTCFFDDIFGGHTQCWLGCTRNRSVHSFFQTTVTADNEPFFSGLYPRRATNHWERSLHGEWMKTKSRIFVPRRL